MSMSFGFSLPSVTVRLTMAVRSCSLLNVTALDGIFSLLIGLAADVVLLLTMFPTGTGGLRSVSVL